MNKADSDVPHQVLDNLKQDIDDLRKKLTQPDTRLNELFLEMESLKENIHQLTGIFQRVLDGLKTDDPSKNLRTVIEKIDAVVSQNETIARGMIAISDRLGDVTARPSGGRVSPSRSALPYPVQHTMGAPSGPSRLAPRPAMPTSPSFETNLPPPPPPESKKRMGVFS
ncbi:hypothetical protein J4210_05775 [Candidatus Woesearchaeota archaeon]|nr:hypothetical protein [Candidatus Woesearchaeota archaeon]